MSANYSDNQYLLYLFLFIFCVIWVEVASAESENSNPSPAGIESKPLITQIMSWQSPLNIVLKFRQGTSYRVVNGKIVSLTNQEAIFPFEAVLNKYPVEIIARLFSESESSLARVKSQIELKTGEQAPDLNSWFMLTVGASTNAVDLVNALNGLDDVETAYPAPLPAPPPVTPSFVSQQGYLQSSLYGGIDAEYGWTVAGGTGSKVKIIDIEYGFNQKHEDLPEIKIVGGTIWQHPTDPLNNHGTAVLGEVVSINNNYGVTGIIFGATAQFVSPCFGDGCSVFNIAEAINIARNNTTVGDVILLEQQTIVCNGFEKEYGPVEWLPAEYDAIVTATKSMRYVVEAAGNGYVNLDKPECNNRFDRITRDSGAIIVGAGAPPNFTQPERSRLDFSDYGKRVDLQGWGQKVVTTGYNDLYNGGSNANYTAKFNGTSSASPIVAGAVAILSSFRKQANLPVLSPVEIRARLVSTGLPQQDAPNYPATQNIGPRPNLRTALTQELILWGNLQSRGGWRSILGGD